MSIMACFQQPATDDPHFLSGPNQQKVILSPDSSKVFHCPWFEDTVAWMTSIYGGDIYLQADTTFLFFSAKGSDPGHGKVARIGMAIQTGDRAFQVRPQPIIFPSRSDPHIWGMDIPKIVEDHKGTYWMTYNTYDQKGRSTLAIAKSRDLQHWSPQAASFGSARSHGIILADHLDGKKVATYIDGYYYLFAGKRIIQLYRSSNLLQWTPVPTPSGAEHIVLTPRRDLFDREWVNPVEAIWKPSGILLLYNGGVSHHVSKKPIYAAGQAVLKSDDPTVLMSRSAKAIHLSSGPSKDLLTSLNFSSEGQKYITSEPYGNIKLGSD